MLADAVRVKGQGYLAASIVLWLRRLSPRLRVLVDPFPPVIPSPRAVCGCLRGERKGTIYTASFIGLAAYPEPATGDVEEGGEVLVREPLLSLEACRGAPGEGTVLPASILSVQLALCARDKRVYRIQRGPLPLSDEVAKPLWELLEALDLVHDGGNACPPGFHEGRAEVVARAGTYSEAFEVPVFLDENVEQVAALVACRLLGREVSTPPRLVVLDAGDRVFFEVGALGGDSSVKLRVGESGFVRVVYSRSYGRMVGVRGVVDRRLAEGVLDSSVTLLLSHEELCRKVPALAVARSSLFEGCAVLRGLLGLAARLCI